MTKIKSYKIGSIQGPVLDEILQHYLLIVGKSFSKYKHFGIMPGFLDLSLASFLILSFIWNYMIKKKALNKYVFDVSRMFP